MKTFTQYIKEGNASDFSYAPDTMGEDLCMPGNTMVGPGRLPEDQISDPSVDVTNAPDLTEPEDATGHEMLDEHLAHVNGKWALVSKKTGRPLRYFHGPGKPSAEWVSKQERSVQYWKHQG